MTLRNPTRFHPGQYLGDEMEHRRIFASDIFNRSGIPRGEVTNIIAGNIDLTDDHCEKIAKALGMSPNTWRRLQASWDKECRG